MPSTIGLPAALLALAAAAAAVPLPRIESMQPQEAPRGGAVTFTAKSGSKFPAAAEDIEVFLNGRSAGKACHVADDVQSFVFCIPPEKTTLGVYNVRVMFRVGEKAWVPAFVEQAGGGVLTIHSEAGKARPKITAISPLLSYPDKELYGFDVIGEGFSPRGPDNVLIIENRGEVPVCWSQDDTCDKDTRAKSVAGEVVSDRELRFRGVSSQYHGVAGIQVRVGHQYADVVPVTLSRVGQSTPALISVVLFAALAAMVLLLTGRGLGEGKARKYGVVTALLLDKETDTFSLSRFQFYAWTAAGILGYLYLVLSTSLVQGRMEFVDVPAGLPAIVLISGGTSILAQWITSTRGPKGAGNVHPSSADFISSGGVVAPERFQFFVWTLIGVAAFLGLVFLQNPGVIKDLPKVPPGFLELMGVSSVGYLGGKLARKAGPVIEEVVATRSGTALELAVRGRNLSKDANLFLAGEMLKSDQVAREVVEPDKSTDDPNMAKRLKLTVTAPKDDWVKPDAELTIANTDGQRATWPYTVK